MMFPCPHCKGKTIVRTSRGINPLLRELNFQCRDAECGHTFTAWLEAYCTLSASSKPDPLVHLPMSEYVRRKTQEQSSLASTWRKATIAAASTGPASPPTDKVRKRVVSQEIPKPDALAAAFFPVQVDAQALEVTSQNPS